MLINNLKKYIFVKNLNEKIQKNIKKLNKVKIIYYSKHFNNTSMEECFKIKKFCSKNNISLYIIDNFKIALKIKAYGVYLSSNNRRPVFNEFIRKKFHIVGSAHNQIEYYFKKLQYCKTIALSPLFFNPKYSKNQILGPTKFNLISKNWKAELCALGGINKNNINKIKLIKVSSISFLRYLEEL